MIYFLQPVEGGPVKIGTTEDLESRHKQLESHYGCRLAILATMPGGRPEETALHRRFAAHRLGRTEQFRPVAEIMAFIGRPLLVGANAETVESMEPAKTLPRFVCVNGRRMARTSTPRPHESDSDRRTLVVVTVKGTEEWRKWLEQSAKDLGLSVSAFVDLAVTDYAKRRGIKKKPPER